MQAKRKQYRIFYKLEQHMEVPMFILSMVWLYLFIVELVTGLSPFQETLIIIIWILFIVEFALKLLLAPRRLRFIKQNWITIIALVIPAFRALRIFNAFRVLRSVRVINSTKVIRAFTSGSRFLANLKEAQGPQPDLKMHACIIVVPVQAADGQKLVNLANDITAIVKPILEDGTGISWDFDVSAAAATGNDTARTPSEFLDTASFKMAEGPYDMVTVLTDTPLISRKNRAEPGLASPVARITVMSVRSLYTTSRKQAAMPDKSYTITNNAALLYLHLAGHLLGLKDTTTAQSKIMGASFTGFTGYIDKVPSFSTKEKASLQKNAQRIPDRELHGGNAFEWLIFHILMTFRHLRTFFSPLLSNKALLLPLSLPGLATAAIAPALLLVFTAEIWDVGLGMTNGTAAFFAAVSIMFASFYLVRVQSLFLPRREKSTITEHLAVANSIIYFSIFLACIGLFLLLGGLMMVIELYIFPPGLMQTWPTLDRPDITLTDKIRLATFISTVGVTTGALAGGLESRTIIQHLALFKSKV